MWCMSEKFRNFALETTQAFYRKRRSKISDEQTWHKHTFSQTKARLYVVHFKCAQASFGNLHALLCGLCGPTHVRTHSAGKNYNDITRVDAMSHHWRPFLF